jgi:hypothetical protein
MVHMVLSVLLTVFFSVTLTALAGVSCTLRDGYLNAYPWIRCDAGVSAEFVPIAALSIACLLLYTLGVPLAAAAQLYVTRAQLTEPHIARRLGFLFGPYRQDCFWWEFVALGRRAVLAAAIALVPFTQQPLQAAIVMAVLVVSVALQQAFAPFATVLENRLEQLSLYTLLLAFLGVYVAETAVDTVGALNWLPVVVVVLVCVVGLLLFAVTALVLLVRLLPKLASTSVGGRLLARSALLLNATSRSQELQDRLLQPTNSL